METDEAFAERWADVLMGEARFPHTSPSRDLAREDVLTSVRGMVAVADGDLELVERHLTALRTQLAIYRGFAELARDLMAREEAA